MTLGPSLARDWMKRRNNIGREARAPCGSTGSTEVQRTAPVSTAVAPAVALATAGVGRPSVLAQGRQQQGPHSRPESGCAPHGEVRLDVSAMTFNV